MATQYYAAKDGESKGPFTREEIDALLKGGELAPGDLIFHEGLPDWIPARDLLLADSAPPLPEPNAAVEEPAPKKKTSTVMWVIRGILLLLLIGAAVAAVFETKAKNQWLKAYEIANKKIDTNESGMSPKDMTQAIDRQPDSKKDNIEIYVWKGAFFRYELEVQYLGRPDNYMAAGLKSRRVR